MDNDDIFFFNKIKNKINIKKKEHYNSIILKIIDILDPNIFGVRCSIT
jgi:hypothetical protein